MANFTASLMSDGERIVVERRQHWLVLVDRSKLAILGLVVAVVLLVVRVNIGNDGFSGFVSNVLGIAFLVLVVYAVVIFAYRYLHWVNDAFIVTNRRVIQVEGILNKKALDSSLEKINDAVLTENVFGRMFGFGDLEILPASDSGIDRMHMLVDASGFKRAMTEAKHDLELEVSSGRIPSPPLRATPSPTADSGSGQASGPPPVQSAPPAAAAPAPTPSPDDVANAIDRLKGLLDSGAITQAEFDAKK